MAKKIVDEEVKEPKMKKKPKKVKTVYNVPEVKKRKKKRSEKLRIALCILFSLGIICISFPFTTFNFYRTIDGDDAVKAYQAEIDKACEDIKKAEKNLVKATEEERKENESVEKSDIVYPESLPEDNIVGQKCETAELLKAIDEAAQIDRTLYTKESYNVLLDSIYTGRSLLTSYTIISYTGLQLIFGRGISDSANYRQTEGSFQRMLYSIGFLIVPIVGFFVSCLDKKRHLKNIVATVGSAFLIFDLFVFFPLKYIDYGAVAAVIIYIIILIVGIAGFYTKQQEDYWIAHYEECVEKGMQKWLPDGYDEDKRNLEQIQADKAHQALVDSAKNAQKKRSKKK